MTELDRSQVTNSHLSALYDQPKYYPQYSATTLYIHPEYYQQYSATVLYTHPEYYQQYSASTLYTQPEYYQQYSAITSSLQQNIKTSSSQQKHNQNIIVTAKT